MQKYRNRCAKGSYVTCKCFTQNCVAKSLVSALLVCKTLDELSAYKTAQSLPVIRQAGANNFSFGLWLGFLLMS